VCVRDKKTKREWMSVCVCVREEGREREREREKVCVRTGSYDARFVDGLCSAG